MRPIIATLFALTLTAVASAETNAARTIRQKLDAIRHKRWMFEIRDNVAVLPLANESGKTGADKLITSEIREAMGERGMTVIEDGKIHAYLSQHEGSGDWGPAEFGALAREVEAEFVITGVLRTYEAERGIGLPLPGSAIATKANVAMDLMVYRLSENKIVWEKKVEANEKVTVGGSSISRNNLRKRIARQTAVAALSRYFDGLEGDESAHAPTRRKSRDTW